MLDITCKCGQVFHVDDQHLGKRLKCRKCGRLQRLRRPSARRASRLESLSRLGRRVLTYFPGWRGANASTARQGVTNSLARWLPLSGLAYLVAVCVLAATMWTFGDVWLPGTILLFMGRWIFLLPAIVLVPAALFYPRTMLLPLVLAITVVLGPIMGVRTGWRRLLPTEEGWQYRVVTYNASQSPGIAFDIGILARNWKADLVALQECGEDLGVAVSALSGWHHHVSRDLCVVSRYPISDEAVMDRSSLARAQADAVAGVGGAGFVVRLVIETPRGPIGVTTLHLETPRKGLETIRTFDFTRLSGNTTIRDIESNRARAFVDAGPAPALVVGDFNMPVESQIFRRHWGDFADAFSVAGRGLGMTKYNGWIRARIDHVLAGRGWVVRDVSVDEEARSDHRPMIVDLVLTGRQAGVAP